MAEKNIKVACCVAHKHRLGKKSNNAHLALLLKDDVSKHLWNIKPEINGNEAQNASTIDRLLPDVAAQGSTSKANHSPNNT